MNLTSNMTLEQGAAILSWSHLASSWSTSPADVGSATVNSVPGRVFSYTLGGVTRFRFVPNTYSSTLDAFYSNYTSGVLTNLICTRG